MSKKELGRGIKSVELFGTILAAMTNLGERPSLAEIAEATGMQQQQLRPYLVSFQRLGLIEVDPASRGRAFGALAARLGHCRLETLGQRFGFQQIAREISSEHDLLVGLVFWAGHRPTIAKVIPSRTPLDINLRPGTPYNVTGTATGRTFLTYSSDPRVAARAEAELKGSVDQPAIGDAPDRAELARLIGDIREKEYAFVRDAYFPGYNAIAVPVFDQAGQLICTMTIVGTSDGLPEKAAGPLARDIVERLKSYRDRPLKLKNLTRLPDPTLAAAANGQAAALEDRRGVGSAEIAGRILAALAFTSGPRKLKDVCDDAGILPAKAHGYMVSLRKTGLVEKVPESPRYQVGPVPAEMLLVRLQSYNAFETTRALIHELSEDTGMMCFLSTWGTYGPVVVDIARPRDSRHTDIHIGRTLPLSDTATGMLFRAHTSADAQRQALAAAKAIAPHREVKGLPAKDWARISQEVRETGVAATEQRGQVRLRSLAAPVFDHDGEIWFSVTLTGDIEEVAAQEAKLLERLRGEVAKISTDLGYQPETATG
ncbi:IclR family transcriptional regulator [Sinisalibacter aestuarii]|uniref:IclR-ED domain-containing protein n=1 Tax=Sinisalibacter aestuarii TaxID=2949426 RepID=A0ABQ5LSP0_9RHOB|nr:IclR family transcriptional regulator C-terminal domain-containing protein [Sinisalibacter aestuarii]GKY87748.1 hypothetical protein STA1M1_16170 [Sinisalibacter aestuarii]